MISRVDGAVDQPQRAVDVLEHADGVSEHDVVERAFDILQGRGVLDVAEHEVEMRVKQLCALNGFRAEVDADAIGRLQRRQHVPGAAAELEHTLARWNKEAHELAVVVMIGRVKPAPALDLLQCGIDALAQGQLSRIVRRKCKGGSCGRIHPGPERSERCRIAQAHVGGPGASRFSWRQASRPRNRILGAVFDRAARAGGRHLRRHRIVAAGIEDQDVGAQLVVVPGHDGVHVQHGVGELPPGLSWASMGTR